MWVAGLSMQRVAREGFGPFEDTPWSFTPPGIRKATLLVFRPHVVSEIARCTRHSLPFWPSITVPGLAKLLLRLSALECLNILAHCVIYFALC
jgi:hypothetical protein